MSVKVFKYILLIDNLLLIALTILGITLSYLFIGPQIIDTLDISLGILTIAFVFMGVSLIIASFCFIGIIYSRVVCLHFTASLILCIPLALAVWLVVEQFLFSSQVNYIIVGICITGALLWFVQVICELCLGCLICCQPEALDELDKEKGDVKASGELGTDEEKEKLVILANEPCPPPPRRITLEGVKEEDNEPNPEEEDDIPEEENEQDYRDIKSPSDRPKSGIQDHDVRPIDEDAETTSPSPDSGQGKSGHPMELPLETIPEERQRLLANVKCPLATPEDTRV